jgi:hypothetical protein
MADDPVQADSVDADETGSAVVDLVSEGSDDSLQDSGAQAESAVHQDSVSAVVGDFRRRDSDVPVVSAALRGWGDYLLHHQG